jgi:hypothetical protein
MSNNIQQNKFIIEPCLYNIGRIYDNSILRLKQGLRPQTLVNNCMEIKDLVCTNMYPVPSTKLSFGTPEIPNNASCVRYLNTVE